jgi:hypothetical protein
MGVACLQLQVTKFTLEQATKEQDGRKVVPLLFL